VPDSLEERRAQLAISVFSRQRPTQSCGEGHHVLEKSSDPGSPVSLADVYEWIDVNMRVPGVAEDDSLHFPFAERLSHAPYVVGQLRRRHRSILDELHGRHALDRGEDWTCRVAQLPEIVFALRCQSHVDMLRSCRLEGRGQLLGF